MFVLIEKNALDVKSFLFVKKNFYLFDRKKTNKDIIATKIVQDIAISASWNTNHPIAPTHAPAIGAKVNVSSMRITSHTVS